MSFSISDLPLLNGQIGICPMPGRGGFYEADLSAILRWSPDLVMTMTPTEELLAKGADHLADDLRAYGISWHHLPIPDFGVPPAELMAAWSDTSALCMQILAGGGRVLAHCMGGCGRSGMALLRLMVDAGEPPDDALARLRAVRPCAVETVRQLAWAKGA